MEDWEKRLLEILVNFNEPLTVADIKRLVGVPGDDDETLFKAIARINETLPKSQYKLVVEDQPCLGCGSWNLFTGENVSTCRKCGKDLVPYPKFCINLRDPFP